MEERRANDRRKEDRDIKNGFERYKELLIGGQRDAKLERKEIRAELRRIAESIERRFEAQGTFCLARADKCEVKFAAVEKSVSEARKGGAVAITAVEDFKERIRSNAKVVLFFVGPLIVIGTGVVAAVIEKLIDKVF